MDTTRPTVTTDDLYKNSSKDNLDDMPSANCQNCKAPVVLKDRELKSCCGALQLVSPGPRERYVNLCCQTSVRLLEERFDVYVCFDCERIRVIDESLVKAGRLTIFQTRSLTSQETKLLEWNQEMKREITELRKQLKRKEILPGRQKSTGQKEMKSESAKIQENSKESDEGLPRPTKTIQKKTKDPIKKIWKKFTGNRTYKIWPPTASTN